MIRKMRPIGDFCERITSGGTPSSGNASYYGGEIPWLRTQEVTFNRIHETEMKITEAGLKNSAAKWIPENSVVVAMYGASAGRVATNAIPLTTNQACCNLLVNDGSDYRFVYYALMNSFESLAGAAKGAAQNNLNAGQIREFQIPWRPLDEQSKVADVLWTIDDLIENNRRRIKLLEAAARLIYRDWFVRLRFPGQEIAKFEQGVPESWERMSVARAVEFNPRESLQKGEMTFVPMGALSDNGMTVDAHLTEIRNTGTTVKFRNGDTLLARITPCLENGKTAYVGFLGDGEIASGSTEFIVMRGSKVGPCFTYCLARSEEFRGIAVASMVGSSGRQRAQVSVIGEFSILLPPPQLLEDFESTVQPMFDQVWTLVRAINRLTEARDLLLPRLMSGEIEV